MSGSNLESYITHLPIFRVVVCDFCESCIPPKNPLDHYEQNHTASKGHPIPMKIRREIAAYMKTLDLCEPKEVIPPENRIPQLKIAGKGFVCKFPDCGKCAISEPSMRTHYYEHRDHIPKDFKDWEETSFQTFFDGHHKK